MSAESEPTNTAGLRDEFRIDLSRRFRALRAALVETVEENDVFGLPWDAARVQAAADDISPADGFSFDSRAEAQDEFQDWLNGQINRGIAEPIERTAIRDGEHYTGRYIRSSYSRGVEHADAQLNAEGLSVPDEDLQAVFNRGIHEDQLQTLYTRAFDNLETVMSEMETAVRRELSTGLQQGWNPQKTARELRDRADVAISDAERLARTETLHSHNTAAASRYQEHGISEVDVLTYNPCDTCQSLAAQNPHPVEDAPLVPRLTHPNCVCTIAPRVENN